MTVHTEVKKFMGKEAVVFSNSKLEAVVVPELGSNLISLVWKYSDTPLLRTPKTSSEYEENPCLFGIPVLFPPNRIDNGSFTYGGKDYSFEVNETDKQNHLHGFLADKPWRLTKREQKEDRSCLIETEINSGDFPEILKQFPHPFILKMCYELTENELKIRTTVRNTGEEAFPWGLGFHTTFLYPLGKESSPEDCTISLPVNEQWELNDRSLPTGRIQPLSDSEQFQHGFALEHHLFDDVYSYSGEEEITNQAVLEDRKAGLKIQYECSEQFGHWVLFNGNGKDLSGFVCPEPYTWVTNAPNVDLPPERTGLRELKPQEEAVMNSKISIKTI